METKQTNQPKETANNAGLIKLVKNSPLWKSLSSMPIMAMSTFSYCLAGYCPMEKVTAHAEVHRTYKTIKSAMTTIPIGKEKIFYLCGIAGWERENDCWFPMLAYKKYCELCDTDYPLSDYVFSKEYLEKYVANMQETSRQIEETREFLEKFSEKYNYVDAETLGNQPLAVQPNTEGTPENQQKQTDFGNQEIIPGVKLSVLKELLDKNSKSYLPRLPILLRLAVKVHNIKEYTTRYAGIVNNNDLKAELAGENIGQPTDKNGKIQAVNPDIEAIKRILKRKKVLPGGREPNPIDDPNPYF